MRWEDERYVRIYTRDTADWLALSFDAQALFCLLLRKVDRAGILALGKHGRKAVAVVLGQVAIWTRLDAALAELEADGCVRVETDRLIVPNFLEAQEARASDRARAQKARDLARLSENAPESQGVTPASQNVTAPSQNVTPASRESDPRHTASRGVTPSRAVPCRADPAVPDQDRGPSAKEPAPDRATKATEQPATDKSAGGKTDPKPRKPRARDPDMDAYLARYRERFASPAAEWTGASAANFAKLRKAHPLPDLLRALDGLAADKLGSDWDFVQACSPRGFERGSRAGTGPPGAGVNATWDRVMANGGPQ